MSHLSNIPGAISHFGPCWPDAIGTLHCVYEVMIVTALGGAVFIYLLVQMTRVLDRIDDWRDDLKKQMRWVTP